MSTGLRPSISPRAVFTWKRIDRGLASRNASSSRSDRSTIERFVKRPTHGELAAHIAQAREAEPPRNPNCRSSRLVDLASLEPSLNIDLRYSGSNNILGVPVYPDAIAVLQEPVAGALLHAHVALSATGVGITVLDAYRPWFITKLFWDLLPRHARRFFADPAMGSNHNRGCAVDVTLHGLANGRELRMPSGFDETSCRAYPDYEGGSGASRNRRDLLRKVMAEHNFTVDPMEWWHFDYVDALAYPLLNLPAREALHQAGAP